MDRRLTPFSGRVALASVRNKVPADHYTDGTPARVRVPCADLLTSPGGARDRQVLLGEAVVVIDTDRGHAFVQAQKDGYCGWLPETALGPDAPHPTHWVCAPATHVYPEPRVQAAETASLSLGARLPVLDIGPKWAETPLGFVPAAHLRALGDWAQDPVAVAESLLGTPYLWGGNSRAGIDCSGLVQAALLACGIPCPADSDQQQATGQPIAEDAPLRRGDLLFWKGHVAMIADETRLIHANGHTMSVAHEETEACIARILAQEHRPVIARRRP